MTEPPAFAARTGFSSAENLTARNVKNSPAERAMLGAEGGDSAWNNG